MANGQWVCQKCSRVGGFILKGVGFVQCSGCGALHVVSHSGSLELCHYLQPYQESVLDKVELERQLGK